jgi:ABC-type polysaccharide/polyol phosphate transport system ATPase subunit
MTTIEIENVSKRFRASRYGRPTLFQLIRGLGQSPSQRYSFEALKNVSLKIERGDKVGLIGKNGAGKTTLMRLIHGIYEPNEGSVRVDGKVVAILQLGIGLIGILSVRDNIFFYGAILGMTADEIRAHYDQILAVSELGDFEGAEVRQLSTGMRQRLAFAVAMTVKADVLLLDEVLAVGDQAFRDKCYGYLTEKLSDSVTVLYASHNLASVKEYFPKTIWLENGRLVEYGDTSEVLENYKAKYGRPLEERQAMSAAAISEHTDA